MRRLPLISATVACLALLACDDTLGRWDKARVELDAEAASDDPADDDPTDDPTGGDTPDLTPPTAPTVLRTLRGSASGDDVRVSSSATVVLSWQGAADQGGSGIRDYTLHWFATADCSGQETAVAGITGTSYQITGSNGQSYSFKVMVFDGAGLSAESACSPSVRIDTTAPPPLTSFSASMGTAVATVRLELGRPADLSDIDHISIRRRAGSTAPTSCSSDDEAQRLAPGDLTSDPFVVIDEPQVAGGTFSYRACVLDAAGNEAAIDDLNATSKAHIMFLTAVPYDAKFGGVGGLASADAACAVRAMAAVTFPTTTEEPNWSAVLSDDTIDAIDRIEILGQVITPDGFDIASTATQFWTGTLTSSPNTDDQGALQFVAAWTGTIAGGAASANNCANWSDTSAGNGTVGDAGAINGTWLDNGVQLCTTTANLYCISQPAP